jgi:transcriptional regulator with XRE-family HTH domain
MNKDKSNRTSKGLTEGQVTSIKQLKADGFASRYIASLIGVSKTTVNNLLNGRSDSKDKVQVKEIKDGARVLLFDLEVAGDIGLFFGRFKINMSQESVVKKGGYILCASWKKLGSSSVESIHLTPGEIEVGNDSRIVEKLHELYSESDAVLCHNSKGYDHRVLQARSAYWDMPALPLVKVLDTLELAKRALRLPSNKLGSIAAYFNLPLKMDHSGISLWVNVQAGDVSSMRTMVEYCKQDVVVLEAVWDKLKHTGKSGSDFNSAIYHSDSKQRCRTCGSDDISKTGRTVSTSSSVFDEYICNDCGALHRGKLNKLSKTKRESLLV